MPPKYATDDQHKYKCIIKQSNWLLTNIPRLPECGYKSLVTTTCNLIMVKLRPDSFFNKIILYCINCIGWGLNPHLSLQEPSGVGCPKMH